LAPIGSVLSRDPSVLLPLQWLLSSLAPLSAHHHCAPPSSKKPRENEDCGCNILQHIRRSGSVQPDTVDRHGLRPDFVPLLRGTNQSSCKCGPAYARDDRLPASDLATVLHRARPVPVATTPRPHADSSGRLLGDRGFVRVRIRA